MLPVTVSKYGRTRFWAVRDGGGELICVCVYKRGAMEVARRLGAKRLPVPVGQGQGSDRGGTEGGVQAAGYAGGEDRAPDYGPGAVLPACGRTDDGEVGLRSRRVTAPRDRPRGSFCAFLSARTAARQAENRCMRTVYAVRMHLEMAVGW
jgi:hypothetical protein